MVSKTNKMKARKTFLRYIRELGNSGFIRREEFKKIEERINACYNGWGVKNDKQKTI